ncbi:hypothetical protein M427DRAFT_26816 [Gonapodya prolifera JEL478]|uniref:Uncharacterized protein n=1 Tax=Gonapodya prolifera (strain JEL478) TaxID=1344416 RepID=A0A139AZQ2_GONPJ|nr:hypothetical protein M427DRAFT_26816 [Gonapodya prolifera JEL478]|eukprot:KXS22187.1 hypothetical protein M427DRAFT_26816 [Gonapodya prolifera JEL478]
MGFKWKPIDTALNRALTWTREDRANHKRLTGVDEDVMEVQQLLEEWYDVYQDEGNKKADWKRGREASERDEQPPLPIIGEVRDTEAPKGSDRRCGIGRESSSATTPILAKRRKPRMADIAESQVVDVLKGLMDAESKRGANTDRFQEEDVRLRKEFLEVERMKAQLERDRFEREEKDREAALRKDKAMVALLTKLVADGHK